MFDLRFTPAETRLLSSLLHREVKIVWDINAFYFVTSTQTYTLECLDAAPAGAASDYDEVFSCQFREEIRPFLFDNEQDGYWYKIITPSTVIQALTVVETVQSFPSGTLLPPNAESTETITALCLGLLATTPQGIIPALLKPELFGFDWLEKYSFYSHAEINSILDTHIKQYVLKQIISVE